MIQLDSTEARNFAVHLEGYEGLGTGELVKNGNFSEIGSDLVTNGDFSAAGSNLITNPNFTDGVEQLTQPIDLTVDFVVNSGGVIDDSNSFTTSGGIFDGIKNTTGAFPTGKTLQVGKSYKLVIEGSTTSSGFSIGRLTMSGNEYGVGFGTHYFTLLEVGIWIRQQTAGTTDLTTFTIEELGADWTTVEDTISFSENGLVMTSTEGTDVNVRTTPEIVEDGKSYKVTYTIHAVGLTGTNSIQYYTGSTLGYQDLPEQSVGTHTFYHTKAAGVDYWYFKLENGNASTTDTVTISSISVQELGEGWTIGGTQDATHYVEFIETGARFVLASTSPLIELKQTIFQLIANKSYKLTVDMTRVSGSVKVDTSGVSELFDATTSGTNNTRYITPTGNMYLSFYRQSTPTDITFHSVSVEELDPNEYWSLGTGWSIGADLANVNNDTSSGIGQDILEAGKSYKVSFEILRVASGGVRPRMGGLNGTLKDTVGIHSEILLSDGVNFQINTAIVTNEVDVTNVSVRVKNTGNVTLTLTNQLTEKVTTVELTPLVTNGRYTEFSYQPTDLIEGMYLIKFTGDLVTYAETLAYITTGTPPLGESSYKAYTTGDDNPDHVYIP